MRNAVQQLGQQLFKMEALHRQCLSITMEGRQEMVEKAKTTAFSMSLLVDGDELSYREVTSLDIYGRAFEHVDEATLQRIVYD